MILQYFLIVTFWLNTKEKFTKEERNSAGFIKILWKLLFINTKVSNLMSCSAIIKSVSLTNFYKNKVQLNLFWMNSQDILLKSHLTSLTWNHLKKLRLFKNSTVWISSKIKGISSSILSYATSRLEVTTKTTTN